MFPQLLSDIQPALPLLQIVLAVMLIGGVLLQRSESGLGGAFGGAGNFGAHHVRRGFEKTLFQGTIVIAILFALITFLPRLL